MEDSQNKLYSEFKIIVRKRGFTLKEVADKIGLSENGLKSGFINSTLKTRTVKGLSELLDINPSFFFIEDISIVNEDRAPYSSPDKDKKIEHLKQTLKMHIANEERQEKLIDHYKELCDKLLHLKQDNN